MNVSAEALVGERLLTGEEPLSRVCSIDLMSAIPERTVSNCKFLMRFSSANTVFSFSLSSLHLHCEFLIRSSSVSAVSSFSLSSSHLHCEFLVATVAHSFSLSSLCLPWQAGGSNSAKISWLSVELVTFISESIDEIDSFEYTCGIDE